MISLLLFKDPACLNILSFRDIKREYAARSSNMICWLPWILRFAIPKSSVHMESVNRQST
jgi:hypothetical protein